VTRGTVVCEHGASGTLEVARQARSGSSICEGASGTVGNTLELVQVARRASRTLSVVGTHAVTARRVAGSTGTGQVRERAIVAIGNTSVTLHEASGNVGAVTGSAIRGNHAAIHTVL